MKCAFAVSIHPPNGHTCSPVLSMQSPGVTKIGWDEKEQKREVKREIERDTKIEKENKREIMCSQNNKIKFKKRERCGWEMSKERSGRK